jgi:hypothetical protein
MSDLSIRIEGLPETVQRIADALDEAFPGQIAWTQTADYGKEITIAIEGFEMPSKPIQSRIDIAA